MDEAFRIAALKRYQVSNTAPDAAFDDVVKLAVRLTGVRVALISFVTETSVWIKASEGTKLQGVELPKAQTYCAKAVDLGTPLIVPDVEVETRYKVNLPKVDGETIRFYAGVPLLTPEGFAVGAICLVDMQPRELSPILIDSLEGLSRMVVSILESRVKAREEQESSRILSLLSEISEASSSKSNVRDVIEKCLSEVCKFSGSTLAHYFEADDAKPGFLKTSGQWFSAAPEKFARFKEITNLIEFTKGVGLPGLILESGKPMANIAAKTHYPRSLEGQRLGLSWAFGFPIVVNSKIVGIFEFFLERPMADEDRLLKVMLNVGDQVARVMERAQTEDTLEKQKEFLDAVLENLADGVVACDNDGKLTIFNRATRDFHGLPADAGLDPSEWSNHYKLLNSDGVTPLSLNEIPLRRAFNGYVVKGQEFAVAHTNGRVLDLVANGRAIHAKDGRKLGAVVTMQDVTQAKKDQNQLLETNRALRAATAAKSQFLANMSHEIRTPLNGVMGMAELLLQEPMTADQREQVEIILSSSQNLLTIIGDILDFSKVEAGKLDLEKLPFNLADVVDDTYKKMENLATSKGLRFLREVKDSELAMVQGDSGRVRQVLTNLMMNAIKFTQEGYVETSVRLMDLEDEVGVRIDIKDTGIGMSQSTIDTLFQAFSQADSSTTRKFGGTGLGLSITKRLVELMDGEIGVESELGKGTLVWLTLRFPKAKATRLFDSAAEETKLSEPSTLPPKARLQQRHMRILLAEDNQVNQVIARQMLTKLGIETDVVENGRQALDALELRHYDLVLMDCQMPELDGYEASREIRRDVDAAFNNILIVAMTANAMKGDREKCLAAGMDDYLTKPVKIEELSELLARHLAPAS